jgi:hypothetical protein
MTKWLKRGRGTTETRLRVPRLSCSSAVATKRQQMGSTPATEWRNSEQWTNEQRAQHSTLQKEIKEAELHDAWHKTTMDVTASFRTIKHVQASEWKKERNRFFPEKHLSHKTTKSDEMRSHHSYDFCNYRGKWVVKIMRKAKKANLICRNCQCAHTKTYQVKCRIEKR